VGKSGVLEHRSGNISETGKDRGKVTMEGLQELTNALSDGTNTDALWPPLPQDWVFATPSQTAIAIISGTGKAINFKFDQYIYTVHPNKSPLKILEKGSVGISRDCPNFLSTRHYLRNG